jgi:hypothetical protein
VARDFNATFFELGLVSAEAQRVTAKTFLVSILCASAVFTIPSIAANPEGAKQELSPLAQWKLARARSAATKLLEDVRMLDAAVDQWAIENNKRAGEIPTPQELAVYLKKGTHLHTELAAGRLNDSLGNPMTLRGVDSVPLLSKASVEQFASVVQPGFWGPYYEDPELSDAALQQPAVANPTTKIELRVAAVRLLEEMRMIDAAMDQWAIENNKLDGAQARPQDLIVYVKKGTRLHGELAAGRVNDSLGNPITIPPMGEIPTISEATAKRFAPAVPAEFWKPFIKE